MIKKDPFCILNEQERFYKDLYKRSNNGADDALKMSSFVSELNIPTLSEEQIKKAFVFCFCLCSTRPFGL